MSFFGDVDHDSLIKRQALLLRGLWSGTLRNLVCTVKPLLIEHTVHSQANHVQ